MGWIIPQPGGAVNENNIKRKNAIEWGFGMAYNKRMNDQMTLTLDTERCWQAVLDRDASCDGQFVTAVRSTGIYCRPSCSARKPLRKNVTFFLTPAEAEAAGYRACRRCRPTRPDLLPEDLEGQKELAQRICRRIEAAEERAPSLAELAAEFHTGLYHLQRTFKRWTGLTPRQYAEAVRQKRLKNELREQDTVSDALYASGYNSSSSLYEQAANTLGMTPAAYRRGGENMNIQYTIIACPLGYLLVASTENGICSVMLGDSPEALRSELAKEFPAAGIASSSNGMAGWVTRILNYLDGYAPALDLPLDIQGTLFQWKVWRALQSIPYGSTRSYKQVAQQIGQPRAVRAVAHACATNPVALLIPCHRVVQSNGGLAGYRWGVERKKALLAREAREK